MPEKARPSMFQFPVTVDSIEDIPEENRAIYQVTDGETGATLIEILRRKIEAGDSAPKAIDAERNSKVAAEMVAETWKAKVKELFEVDTVETLDDRWSEIRATHVKAIEDIRGKKGDSGVSFEKGLQRAIALRERKMAEELARVEEERRIAIAEKEAICNALEDYMRNNAAMQALSAAKAFGMVLLPHVIARIRVIKDGKGKHLLRVVDESGDERFDANGQPMTVEGLVANMRQSEEYSSAFDTDRATDSDWRSMSSGINPWSRVSFNATEQAKILKSNPELARRLKQQAAAEA
jgi:hypothetical protein